MSNHKTTRRLRSRRRAKTERRLTFEQLENRNLLAGNVTASVIGGDLVVTGDNAGNGVVISQVNARTYKVAGIQWEGRATTVNGRSEVVVTGVHSHLTVDMRGGRDAVAVTNKAVTPSMLASPSASSFQGASAVQVPRDVTISGGAGDDVLVLGGVLSGGSAALNGDSGADTLLVAHSTISFNLSASGNAGNDKITVANSVVGIRATLHDTEGLNDFTVSGVTVAFVDVVGGAGNDAISVSNSTISFLTMNTGSGNDRITLERILVSELNVDTGVGNDTLTGIEVNVTNARISTGAGSDNVELRSRSTSGLNLVTGNLTIDTGDDNDTVTLSALAVDGNLRVLTGRGNDQVRLTGVDSSVATLETGDGADQLVLNAVVADQLFARLGSGDDFLSLANSRIGQAVLDGGLGRDQFDERSGNTIQRRQVTNFERLTLPRPRPRF